MILSLATRGDIANVLHANTPRAGLRKQTVLHYNHDAEDLSDAADIVTSFVVVTGQVHLVPVLAAA